jgi:hypothetical protein
LLAASLISPELNPVGAFGALINVASYIVAPLMGLALCGLTVDGLRPLEAIRNSVLIAANNLLTLAAVFVLTLLAHGLVDIAVVTVAYGPAWDFPLTELYSVAYGAIAHSPIAAVLSGLAAVVLPLVSTLVTTFLYVQWVGAVTYPGVKSRRSGARGVWSEESREASMSEPEPTSERRIQPAPIPEPGVAGSAPGVAQRKGRLAFALVALLLALGLCVVICVAASATSSARTDAEKPGIESVLDQFMNAMERRDLDEAYSLFSTRARRQVSRSEIGGLLEGSNYVLVEGYQRLSITRLRIEVAVNTNPDIPQGTLAHVEAAVEYEGGFTGSMQALLEQEQGEWRLFTMNVQVPPDKFGP